MRKIDKKLNFQKVNMLAEQRYLESKGIIKEGMYEEGMYEENIGECGYDEPMMEDGMLDEFAKNNPVNPIASEIADFTDTIPEVNEDGSIRFMTENGKLAFFVSPTNGTIIMLTPDEMKSIFARRLNDLLK